MKCPGYPVKELKWSSKHEVLKVQNADAYSAHAVPLAGDEERLDSSSNPVWPSSIYSQDFAGSSFTLDTDVPFEPASGELNLDLAIPDLPIDEGPVSSLHDEDGGERLWDPSSTAEDRRQADCTLTTAPSWNPGLGPANFPTFTDVSTISSIGSPGAESVLTPTTPLNSSLLHVPTLLVEYYFQKVCRECSTFDSDFNPFRTVISKMRGTSAPIDSVIRSLSASKLVEDMPSMKLIGIEAQWQALENVQNECLQVTALHNVSDEALYTILLLGMTTSWHVRDDLGLEYLALANRVVSARAESPGVVTNMNREFFQNALMYWNMIVSLVSESVETPHGEIEENFSAFGPLPIVVQKKKIMPHPWAGIQPKSQELFGRVLRLVRRARGGFHKSTTSTVSRAAINNLSKAITTAESLEVECWSISIPPVTDVEDTGDLNTPPVHHVLTSKAYLLAALLHIYMAFPDVLENQVRSCLDSGLAEPTSDATPETTDSAHTVSKSWLWGERAAGDPLDAWVRDIGIRIVECLEMIGVQSGTRVVHPPLLLSVASALTLPSEKASVAKDGPTPRTTSSEDAQSGRQLTSNEAAFRVRQARQFMIARLEIMQALMRFRAIDNILTVVKEVWKRADAGTQDFFWMDVMAELHCETLFG